MKQISCDITNAGDMMVEYNIGCPYFAGDERCHCNGSEELPTRKMCGECKLEWLEAEVDE